MKPLLALRDLLYPPRCAECGGRGENPRFEPYLCLNCREELFPEVEQWCPRCAAPRPGFTSLPGCPHCRRDRFAFAHAWALGVHRGALRKALLRLKHRENGPLAGVLGAELGRQVRRRPAEAIPSPEVVVPVSMHWWRRLRREGNPAEWLADAVARSLGIPCERVLRTRRRVPRQSLLAPSARRRNVRGAFCAAAGYDINGACVLLVDDVMTTGATSHEAARTLLRAGAAHVLVAVAARGLGAAAPTHDSRTAPF